MVKNDFESDGSLSQVQSKRNADALVRSYASNFQYNAAGAVTSMKLGNGRFENTVFNSRLQPIQIGLGTSANSQNLFKLDYSYGTTANNGNVLSQTITVPTVGASTGFTATQTYTYDSLNRIAQATENITGITPPSWKQTFTYDRYGNRNFDEANTTTLPKECNGNTEVCAAIRPIVNPSVNTANNRLIGFIFDNSGNTTTDAENRKFVYDGENKQTEVRDSLNNIVGQYFYDGDGKRIKKHVPATGETTIFVYDASGKLVAEYSTVVEPPTTAKISYLTNDHLGSPRINTDANGAVIARHDYHPFGEEVIGIGGRTAGLNYANDDVRKQFTGYEMDIESSLDFAQARYYKPGHGRFTSVDPLMASADILNPQTFNRYVYVGNNPINMNDPTEEIWGVSGTTVQWFDDETAMKKAGFSVYEQPFAINAAGATVVLNPGAFDWVVPNDAAHAIRVATAYGVSEATIAGSAAALGVSAVLVAAYIAAIRYSPGQVDATMDDCMACGRMIQNHVNMMNQKADELAAKVNAEARANSQSTPADPNSRKPDPDDDKPRYEQSPKHGKSQRGNAAPAPTNGQATLDTSVQVRSTSSRRVGVDPSTGEFVVFDQTTRGVFHGHVRNWDGLTRGMRNALVKSGQTTRRGRIK